MLQLRALGHLQIEICSLLRTENVTNLLALPASDGNTPSHAPARLSCVAACADARPVDPAMTVAPSAGRASSD